jgi:hypothetical protein
LLTENFEHLYYPNRPHGSRWLVCVNYILPPASVKKFQLP